MSTEQTLQPVTARYLVKEHLSSLGRTHVFENIATHGSTFYGMPPHREVFPGCIVEVSVRIVGIDKKHLPTRSPYACGRPAEAQYVKDIRAKAGHIAAALKRETARD